MGTSRDRLKDELIKEFMTKDSEELASLFIDVVKQTKAFDMNDEIATQIRWNIDQDKRGFCDWAAEGALEALGID